MCKIECMQEHQSKTISLFLNFAPEKKQQKLRLKCTEPSGTSHRVIRTGTYKAAARDSRWVYELVSDLWPDAELYSEYSGDESGEEGGTDQENPYDHKKQ